jgi:hypothetical protein
MEIKLHQLFSLPVLLIGTIRKEILMKTTISILILPFLLLEQSASTKEDYFSAGSLPNISINEMNKLSQVFASGNKITGIESYLPISIVNSGDTIKGTFLDFNNSEGFATLGPDFTFYDFQDKGQSPFKYISNISTILFNPLSGYQYIDKNGSLNSTKEKGVNCGCKSEQTDSTGHVDHKTGAGCIGNVDEYLNSTCGGGWILKHSMHLEMQPFNQLDLSVYLTKEKDGISSEGNCCLIAPYEIAQYFQKEKWDNAPSANDRRNYNPRIEEKKLYDERVNSDGSMKNSNMFLNKNSFCSWPEMYIKARTNTIQRYGKCEDLSIWDSRDIVRDLGASYGHDVGFFDHADWGVYAASVPTEISNNRPLLWSMTSNTYSNHTTALCGYEMYTKQEGWGIFKNSKAKLFFELCDDWSATSTRFFDSTAYFGFGELVRFTY